MSRRSVLFSPGDRPEMLRKAPTTGADVVVFDLEDAVVAERKAAAREHVREVLLDPAFDPDCEVCVRVARPTVETDLAAILRDGPGRLDSVMYPKADSAREVRDVGRLVRDHGSDLPLLVLVETPRAVLDAAELAAARPTDALVFGAEDLAASLGATRTPEGTEVIHAREQVVLAAAAADVDAIDTVVTDFENLARLAEDARVGAGLGYDGKLAIHPAQIAPIHDAFAPDEETVAWARRVVEAVEGAASEGRGVARVDGRMVDAPIVAQAERVLDRAETTDDF